MWLETKKARNFSSVVWVLGEVNGYILRNHVVDQCPGDLVIDFSTRSVWRRLEQGQLGAGRLGEFGRARNRIEDPDHFAEQLMQFVEGHLLGGVPRRVHGR